MMVLRYFVPGIRKVLGLLFFGGMVTSAMAEQPLQGGIDPERVRQIEAMLGEQTFAFGPRISDRVAWQRLAATAAYSNVIHDAESALTKPLPEMTKGVYMLYVKTGQRTKQYMQVRADRYDRITLYTLAECLEDKGRFIKPLQDVLKAVAGEKTWVYNFHDSKLDNYEGRKITIDLGSANLAADLGACLYLVGDRLNPEIRQQVADKLRERIFTPYQKAIENRDPKDCFWWMTCKMNWNSVCHAGVVAAAMGSCPDRHERAMFVAAAEKYIRDYLEGFDGEGYCAEGMGYWNYGFSHYVQLCETIYQATAGRLDLYTISGARDAALYPLRMRLLGNVYPAYADCGLELEPLSPLMSFINRRYGFGVNEHEHATLSQLQHDLVKLLMYTCPNSATQQPVVTDKDYYEIRSFFPSGVLNARPLRGTACRMAVSLKGRHNDEPHNHNDLGSYVVAVGDEALILDPGGEVYTARTFSKDRYQSNLLNSYGHPVPVVAGKLQRAGAKARARVVATTFTEAADTFSLDLRSAYDVAGLQTLTRTFRYSRRDQGSLTVTDDFAYDKPQAFGTALITYGKWTKLAPNELRIEGQHEGLRVTIDAGGLAFEIKDEQIVENNGRPIHPTRIGINLLEPQDRGKISLTIVPESVLKPVVPAK